MISRYMEKCDKILFALTLSFDVLNFFLYTSQFNQVINIFKLNEYIV